MMTACIFFASPFAFVAASTSSAVFTAASSGAFVAASVCCQLGIGGVSVWFP
jgi:hypothetical protein